MTPSRTFLPCPGCGRTLGLPPEALGKPLNCPHCRAAFHVPRGPDGSPGTVAPGTPPPRPGPRFAPDLPRAFIVPVLALLMLGFAGMLVDGYLSYLFATRPNAAYDYAFNRVIEARSIQSMGDTTAATTDDWEQIAPAAVAGSPLAIAAGEILEDAANAKLAKAWQPSVAPASRYSFAASFLAAVGGLCMVRGRFYWLALLGCVAAIANVNHLCCIPGGIAGVWGILTLVRDEGRLHFGIRPSLKR